MGLSRAGSLGGCSSFMMMGRFVAMLSGLAEAARRGVRIMLIHAISQCYHNLLQKTCRDGDQETSLLGRPLLVCQIRRSN